MDMNTVETVVHKAGFGRSEGVHDADPVTTEILRNSLCSAANQMKSTLCRIAFSPLIYETLDFAAAIYDEDFCMLAQAPSLPLFMGSLTYCVKEASDAVGGPENMREGDVIIYNWPFGTGSHAQDVVLVAPAFLEEKLIGYTAVKAHWLDIAAKEPYCTDTTDVYQEGVIFPGIKLYDGGEVVQDVYNLVMANTRMPNIIFGDMRAQATAVNIGARELQRVVKRFGYETFRTSTQRIYDHGEALVRRYFADLPDGRYVGEGCVDDDGLSDDKIPYQVIVEIDGDTVRVDYSQAPPATRGPINCPVPSTISVARVAISMLAGSGYAPNEGHFRPLEVITRPGTLFHPLPPSPSFLYGWPALQSIDVIYNAIGKAKPEAVPACSGCDIPNVYWWGYREKTGEPWAHGGGMPCGGGAHVRGDGTTMYHVSLAQSRISPLELAETKFPLIYNKFELARDSCGAGKNRGACGIDISYHVTEECFGTAPIERQKTPPWGLQGGAEARPNSMTVYRPGEAPEKIGKATGLKFPKGSVVDLSIAGGGGYGPPSERALESVYADVADGYISEAYARQYYPQSISDEQAA